MLDIYIIVGLSALLVSTSRAISRASRREASDGSAPRFFFVYVRIIIIFSSVHRGSQVTLMSYIIMGKTYDYEAPVIEIIEVEVEKGFANSAEYADVEDF